MRTLNEILVDMKTLVEELETHIGKPQKIDADFLDEQFVFTGSMNDNMNFTFPIASDTISLGEIGEIKFDINNTSNR
jgi:hypothetical protein